MMPDSSAELMAAIEQARAVASADLAPAAASASPDLVRAVYGEQLADATRAQLHLKDVIERRAQQLRADLDRQLSAMRAELGPLEAQLARLREQIWTVNLYLGRDEQISQLADGEPAPVGTPITLRQMVLAMDEECLVAVEDGGIDANNVDDFGAWLTAHPSHLDQVLPDEKGVVVLVPTRQSRNYGMFDLTRDANKVSYWLIRNGERLFLMKTDIEVGDRLLPRRAEFVDFFQRDPHTWRGEPAGDRVPLEPGTDEWVKAEQKADARRRHFMRIMLVLQGLADRTTVFWPIPDGGVNFLSLAAQDDGRVRIVNELDLVLTSGRIPFRQWQQTTLAKIRKGMRVVGAFHGQDWRDANNEWDCDHGRHARLYPGTADPPDSNVIHVVEDRKSDGGLVIRYERSDDVWTMYEGSRKAKTRASCTVYPTDEFVIPIDLVTVAELEQYLHARTERHAYLSMIPLVKTAITALRAEQQAEEPFRLMLAGRIAAAHNLDVAEVSAELPGLVDWWKLTNRWHRPLVADQQAEAAAVAAIESEWAARRADRARITAYAVQDANVVSILATGPVICVARRRDGGYVTYEPAAEAETVWLTERRYRYRAGSLDGDVRVNEWMMLPGRSRATLTMLWSTPAWNGWNHDASRAEHLTSPEMEQLAADMVALASAEGTPLAVTYQAAKDWDGPATRFVAYYWDPDRTGSYYLGGRGSETREPGDRMRLVRAYWQRDQRGTAVLKPPEVGRAATWDRFDNPEWGKAPWSTRPDQQPRLVWSDPQQRQPVLDLRVQIAAANAAAHRSESRSNDAYRSIVQRWEAAEWDRLYQRFLQDYGGAVDLWEGHKKTLRVNFPQASWFNSDVAAVLASGVDLAGLTVGEAFTRAGNTTKLHDTVCALPFLDPAPTTGSTPPERTEHQ